MAQRRLGQPQFRYEYRDQIKARVKYTLSDVKKRGGAFFLILGAFVFSVNGIVSKLLLTNGLESFRLAQIRALGAALIMVIFMVIFKRNEIKVKLREVPNLLIYGAIGIALVNVGYFIAISRLPVGIALIIEMTAPVWVAVWVKFVRKEFVAKSMWLALFVSIFGLIMVAQVWDGLTLDGIGLAAAFISAFTLATYLLMGEKIKGRHSATGMITWGFIGASLFWLLTVPVWTFPTDIFSQRIDVQGKLSGVMAPGWILVLWVVVLGTVLPYIFVVEGLRRSSATVAGAISMSEAVIAGAIAWIWLNESWNLIQLIGGVLVITGILLAERSRTTQSLLVG